MFRPREINELIRRASSADQLFELVKIHENRMSLVNFVTACYQLAVRQTEDPRSDELIRLTAHRLGLTGKGLGLDTPPRVGYELSNFAWALAKLSREDFLVVGPHTWHLGVLGRSLCLQASEQVHQLNFQDCANLAWAFVSRLSLMNKEGPQDPEDKPRIGRLIYGISERTRLLIGNNTRKLNTGEISTLCWALGKFQSMCFMPKQQTEDQFQPVLSVIDSRYLRTHLQDFKDEQLSALIFGLRQLRYSTSDLLRTLHEELQRRRSSTLYPDLLAKTAQYLVHMQRGHREPVESFLRSQEREVSRFSNRSFTEFFYSLFQMSLLTGSPNLLDVFQNSLVARLHAGKSDLNATNLGYLAEIASQTSPNICLSRFYRLAAQNSRVTDPHILGRLVTYGVYALLNPKTVRSRSQASPQLYQDTCVFYRVALRRAISQPLSFYELSTFFWSAATLGRVEPELEALVRQLGHRLQEGDRPASPTYLLILNWSLMALGLVCQPLLNLMASDLILDHLKAFLSKNVRDQADAQGVIQIYLTLLMARYFQGRELVDPEIEALVKTAYVWNENTCFLASPTQADVLDTLRRVSSQFIESEHMTHSGLSIDILCREPS